MPLAVPSAPAVPWEGTEALRVQLMRGVLGQVLGFGVSVPPGSSDYAPVTS